MSEKILIINPFGIGDVLFSTVLVFAIKRLYPTSYIAYICNKRTVDILETNPDIDEVFIFERDEFRTLWKKSKRKCLKRFFDFWHNIHRKGFNIVFDLSLGKEYSFFCWLSGIKKRLGFNYKGRGIFLTHRIPFEGFDRKPVADYYMDLLKLLPLPSSYAGFKDLNLNIRAILIPSSGDESYIDKFLREKGVEGAFKIGIAAGGGVSFGKKGQERRRWPARRFSELADKIVDTFNAKIILIWGPGEEELIGEIRSFMQRDAIIAPRTTLRQMAALCKKCRLVICSEGGPLHIASSQGVSTVSIFGPVDEKVYGPYPRGKNNIVITSGIKCRPCYKYFKLPDCDTKECLEAVTVKMVFDKIVTILQD